jgi:hypothetical protein
VLSTIEMSAACLLNYQAAEKAGVVLIPTSPRMLPWISSNHLYGINGVEEYDPAFFKKPAVTLIGSVGSVIPGQWSVPNGTGGQSSAIEERLAYNIGMPLWKSAAPLPGRKSNCHRMSVESATPVTLETPIQVRLF